MDDNSGMMTYSSCWSSPNNTQCGSSFLQSTGSHQTSEGQNDGDGDVRRRMQQNKRLDDGWTQIPLMGGANCAYSPYMSAASYAITRQMLLRSHYSAIPNPNTFNTLQAIAHQSVSRPQLPAAPNYRAQVLSNIENSLMENDQHLAGQNGQNENDTGLGVRNGIDLACNYEPPSWLFEDQFNTSEANNSAVFTPAKFSTLQDNMVQSAGVEEIQKENNEKYDPKESRPKKKKRKKLVPKVMREDQPTRKPKTVTPKPDSKRKYIRRKGVNANSTPTDVERKSDVYSTSAQNSAKRSLNFDSSFQHSVVVSDVVTFDNNKASENLTNFQEDTRRAKIRGNLRWLAIIGKEQAAPETEVPSNNLSCHESGQTKVYCSNVSENLVDGFSNEFIYGNEVNHVPVANKKQRTEDGSQKLELDGQFSKEVHQHNPEDESLANVQRCYDAGQVLNHFQSEVETKKQSVRVSNRQMPPLPNTPNCSTGLRSANIDYQLKGNPMQPTMSRRAQIRLAHVMFITSKQISWDEVEKTHNTCHDESSDEAHNHNPCIACQYLGPIIQNFCFLSIRDDSCDTVEDLQPQNVLVPYNSGGAIVQYEGPFIPLKKRLPRAKVELDSETNRVWMLLMGKESDVGHEEEDKEKWWEEQRCLFKGRVESFISRMHLVQGDRQFSPWKGSVVDSVVGVFLTQNVSDHLSSSAFLSVVARFPPRPRGEIKERTPKSDDTINDKVNKKEKMMDGHNNNESGSGSQKGGHNDEINSAEQVEKLSQEGSLLSQNCIISSQSSSESPTQPVIAPLEQAPRPDYDIYWLNEEDTLGGSNPFMDLLQMANSSQDLYHGESIFSGDSLNIRTCFSEDKKQPMFNEHNNVWLSSVTSNSFKTCEEKARDDINEVNGQDKPTPMEKECVIQANAASENSKKVPPEAAKDAAKTGKKKAELPKKTSFDWESLRQEVCCDGNNKERHPNAYDSVDWEAVRNADVKEISNTIRARGMNNLLAERIKDFLNRVKEEHGSIDLEWLRDVPPEKAKDFLLSIRGLGLKSTECVRLLTLHHMAFPVDTNVGRICVRLGWVPLQPLPESLQLHLLEMYPMLDTIQKYIWPRLCKFDQRTLYELHYQMITFGKVFCTKSKPNCNACPLKAECKHFASAFASARLALKGPEDETPSTSTNHIIHNISPNPANYPSFAPQLDWNSLSERKYDNSYEPIVELPPSPERDIEDIESMADDAFYDDPDDIPTIDLNVEQFRQNLQDLLQRNDKDIENSDMSKALVALTPYAASLPQPKLKNVSRLRTEHLVYELPDDHPVLEGMDQREADDPSPYLFAMWTSGENVDSMGQSSAEEQAQTVKGTVLIPCRTATKGSFPLNGTYFQVNEVFADHGSSLVPVDVSRESLWKLPRRTVYFGTSVTSIFRGLTTEGIQQCFWKGFVCVRGFDQKSRTPRPLIARLHFPASKVVKNKKTSPKE